MGLSIFWRLLHDQWTLNAILFWICVLLETIRAVLSVFDGMQPMFHTN